MKTLLMLGAGLWACGAWAAAPVYHCYYRELLQSSDVEVDQAFDATPAICGENDPNGMCMFPARRLETKLACRDLALVIDTGAQPPELEVTLWKHCGAAPSPAEDQSQTVSMNASAAYFHLNATWGDAMSVVECRR